MCPSAGRSDAAIPSEGLRRGERLQQFLHIAIEAGKLSSVAVAEFRPGAGLNNMAAGILHYRKVRAERREPFRAADALDLLFAEDGQPVDGNGWFRRRAVERGKREQPRKAPEMRLEERRHGCGLRRFAYRRDTPSRCAVDRLQALAPAAQQMDKGYGLCVQKKQRRRKDHGKSADASVERYGRRGRGRLFPGPGRHFVQMQARLQQTCGGLAFIVFARCGRGNKTGEFFFPLLLYFTVSGPDPGASVLLRLPA